MEQEQHVIHKGMIDRDLTKNELIEELDWNEDTFDFRFKKFCERYAFCAEDFKEKGKYVFRKEWNEILYVLLNSIYKHPLYEDGKEKSPLDKMTAYYKQLLQDIEDWLPRDVRMDLMSHPIYLNTQLEFSMMEKLQDKLASWMSLVTTMSPRVRVVMWNRMNQSIDGWIKIMCAAHIEDHAIQQLLEADEMLVEGEREARLEHLDVLLAHRLRKEIQKARNEKVWMAYLDHIALGLRRFTGEEDDRAFVNKAFEELVVPILEKHDKKRDGILSKLLVDTQKIVDQWKEIGDVLLDVPKELDEMKELPEEKKEEYRQAARLIGEVYNQLSLERTKQFQDDVEGLFQKSVATTVEKSQKMIRSEP